MKRRRWPPETPRPRDDIILTPPFADRLVPQPPPTPRAFGRNAPHPESVMARDQIDMTPLQSRDELVAWLEAGVKPVSEFRIGTEHEKTPFTLQGHNPVPYEGVRGIGALLEGMKLLLGWEPIMERGNIIGLYDVTGGGAISLEPGGQFELSGAPVETVHQTQAELMAHLAQVREIATPLGIGFLGLGMTPSWSREQIPVMPKGRYKIMTNYMPKVGEYGLDMMYRTCTVQTNLDFSSEADMVKKLRVSVALQPVATALFANSPFTEGKPNGFLSFRSQIWRDTDNARSGMIPWAFEDGMGFERWVDYALDVPMYFVKRGDEYIDVAGSSFRAFFEGRNNVLPGERPTLSDWANHLSTIFPEVRLKRYLEMRGADGVPWGRLPALPAFWVGLLYDDASLNAAWDIVKYWNAQERQALRDDVPRLGFKARIRDRYLFEIARECLVLAHAGLRRRECIDHLGRDESRHLDPLDRILDAGRSPAEEMLEKFHGRWQRSVDPAYEEYAF
jgi:glutamate--cysteine ligase